LRKAIWYIEREIKRRAVEHVEGCRCPACDHG
jgi:hypothetical protein